MKSLSIESVCEDVNENIVEFHQQKIKSLKN